MLIRICLLVFISAFLSSPALSMSTDLTARDMFVRQGFSVKWITELPEGSEWLKILPSDNGLRKVRITELALDGTPERGFFSLKSYRPEHYTMVTTFTVSGKDITGSSVPGLYIKTIAFNWEVFLNGHSLRSEMFIDDNGNIASLREYRDVLIPLNPMLMREGENILAFHIVGDPTSIVTGFYRAGPYTVGDYEKLDAERSETVRLILMFMYLFVGLYHLLLYVNRSSDRYNLTFGLTTIFTFLYFFSRTHAVYSFIPDTDILVRFEFAVLFMILPFGSMFFDQILTGKIRRVSICTFVFYLFLAFMVIPTPYSFIIDILRIWQFTAAIPLIYILILIIRHYIKQVRETASFSVEGSSIFAISLSVLWKDTAGNLLLGVLLVSLSLVFDIIDAVHLSLDLGISKYTFLGVIVGMTLMLANRFIYIHKRVEALNIDLENRVDELRIANKRISISEKRYRAIVEGSNDIIFSIDTDYKLLSANRAIEKHLKIKKESIYTLSFLDLIYDADDEMDTSRQIIRRKLEEFLQTREPVSFKTELVSFFMKEPRPMRVRFQFVDAEGSNEIIGIASGEGEDSLLRYFTAEKQRYIIENYLMSADEISRRVTRNLPRYIDQKEADHIRLALREIVLNSIEHGNLNISFQEKSHAMMSDSYFELLASRQKDSSFSQRRVTVEYSVNHKRAVYLVVDEGSGFDYDKTMQTGTEKANEEMLSHGRGITMARNIFDEFNYIGSGNMVKMVKRFS